MPPETATPNDAAATAKRLDDLLTGARRTFERGLRARALDDLARAPAEFHADPKFQTLLTQLSATARQDAERAHLNAVRANAAVRAPDAFQAAEAQWQAATAQRTVTIDSVRGLLRAEELLSRAADTALTVAERTTAPSLPTIATPPVTPPTTLPGTSTPANPPAKPPDRTATTTPTATDNPPGTTKPSSPPVTQTPPQVAPPATDDRAAIQQTLNGWAAAYATLDASRVAAVSALSAQQAQTLQNAFAQQNAHTVTLESCKIQNLTAAAAKAQCRVHRVIDFKGRGSERFDSNLTFELAKRGATWIITSQK